MRRTLPGVAVGCLAAAAWITWSLPTRAAVLEVAPSGGDYTSIQAAVNAAADGDTIRIHAGTYREQVVITTPNLTLEAADPTDPPEIDGSDPSFSPSWTHVSGYVYRTPYTLPFAHTTCDDLTNGPVGDPLLMLYEDGVWLRGWEGGEYNELGCPYSTLADLDPSTDEPAPSGREIRIPGRFYYDDAADELYVWSKDEVDPSGHDFAIPVLRTLISVGASGVTLRQLVLKHTYYYPVIIDGAGDDTTIEGCFLVNTGPWGVYARDAAGVVLRRNFIQLNGFYERHDYISVRFNRLKGSLVHIRGYADAAGCEVAENVVTGTYGITARGQGCRIHDNIVSRSQSLLVMTQVESSIPAAGYDHDTRIFRNVLYDADFSAFSNYNTLDQADNLYYGNTYFYRNLVYAVRYVSKEGCQNSPCDATPDAFIYNNTFALGKLVAHHPYRYPVMGSTVYRNNIFQLRYGNMEMYWVYDGDPPRDPADGWEYEPFSNGPDSDFNLCWRDPENDWQQIARFRNVDDPTQSYAAGEFSLMQTETGLDVHSVETEPLFVHGEISTAAVFEQDYDTFSTMPYRQVIAQGYDNLFPAAFDGIYRFFDVQEGSPAVDSGEVVPSDWPDTVTIVDGMPDIGAIEYGLGGGGGAGEGGGGGTGAAAGSGGSSVALPAGSSDDDSGCGCRVGGARGARGAMAWLLLFSGGLLRRRARR